jgi:hypothetical protein
MWWPMKPRASKRRRASASGDLPIVVVHRDIFDLSAAAVRRHPEIEVGGKFVGFVRRGGTGASRSLGSLDRWLVDHVAPGRTALIVLGSISSGPGAEATAVSLVPDAAFQVAVFRELERRHPDVEHMGSWHSHNPNKLRDFSHGDHEHYSSAVVRTDYNLDAFLAGLCTDAGGLRDGIFDLYTRTAPHEPVRLAAPVVVGDEVLPSLVDELERIEAFVASGSEARPDQAPSTEARALEEGLRMAFGVAFERLVDDESVSWRLSGVGDGVDVAITYGGGPIEHVGMSIRTTRGATALTLDSSGVPSEVESMGESIERVVRDLVEVVARARAHGGGRT